MFDFDYSALTEFNTSKVEVPNFKPKPISGSISNSSVMQTSCESLASFEELNEVTFQNTINAKHEFAPVIVKRSDENGNLIANCYINTHVDEPSAYVELIDVLICADENTTVNIFLNSPGGHVSSGISICNAIVNSKAKVVTYATGMCASIAAVIWSMGDEINIHPWARVMYHMPLHGDYGKSQSILDRAQHITNKFKVLCRMFVYRGLITQEEYDQIVEKRSNLFIPTNTLASRLPNLKPNINFSNIANNSNKMNLVREYTMGGM